MNHCLNLRFIYNDHYANGTNLKKKCRTLFIDNYNEFKKEQDNVSCSFQTHDFNQLKKKFDMNTIKRFLITKRIFLISCNKCPYCLEIKKTCYKRKIKAQLKQSKFSYLITITFNNDNVFTLSQKDKTRLESKDTNLSKIDIANIIKNLKNKINRYYKKKVKLNYFLCGEYGNKTKRAHYHILLMLNDPIPKLYKVQAKGNHWKSDLFESKQFGLYDIQPTNKNMACASYISKYLSKSVDQHQDKLNYNYFEEKQIRDMLKEGIDLDQHKNISVWKNEKAQRTQLVRKQREFLKVSRQLGMSNSLDWNIKNGLINKYYKNKIMSQIDQLNYSYLFLERWLKILDKKHNNFKLIWDKQVFIAKTMEYLKQKILELEIQRIDNINLYFGKSLKVGKNYKNNDIM